MGLHIAYHLTAGDFTTAGEASTGIKKQLRQLGIPSSVLRRIAVAAYEAELNLVIHSLGGDLTADVDAEKIVLRTIDCGPGSPDISLAMKEGTEPVCILRGLGEYEAVQALYVAHAKAARPL